jgi:hypothetical protein
MTSTGGTLDAADPLAVSRGRPPESSARPPACTSSGHANAAIGSVSYDGVAAARCSASGRTSSATAPDYQRAEAGGAERALKALPNPEVVAVGEISAADLLVSDTYAEGGSDRVGR